MKKTLILYKPEYADMAIKLRDNYRAHDHAATDIVSVEEHEDIEYAEEMQYDEAVFIENSDSVIYHDIKSGFTNRIPVSAVFYNDPKPDSHEAVTSRDAFNILADAISDVGSWWCWHVGDDMLQLEFCDVQLYDETKAEKETHTTDVLAVRFYGHVFAVFLDDLIDKNWHERFRDDDSILYPVDTYDMAFDDNKEAEFSRYAKLSAPNTAYRLNKLEERGYIRRTRNDSDKREFRIEPSNRYREEYGVIFDYIHLVCDRIEERFTPDDVSKFKEMLGIISEELMPEAGSQLIERN